MTRAAAVAPTATRTSAVDDEGIRRASSLGLEERRLSNLGEEGLHPRNHSARFVNGRTFICCLELYTLQLRLRRPSRWASLQLRLRRPSRWASSIPTQAKE